MVRRNLSQHPGSGIRGATSGLHRPEIFIHENVIRFQIRILRTPLVKPGVIRDNIYLIIASLTMSY